MSEEATREEVLVLAKQAGLDLPDAYLDELVSAYRHVQRIAARIPKAWAYADEPAHVFVPTTFAREG